MFETSDEIHLAVLSWQLNSNILDFNSRVQTHSHMHDEKKPEHQNSSRMGGCSPEAPLYSHTQTRQEKAEIPQLVSSLPLLTLA